MTRPFPEFAPYEGEGDLGPNQRPPYPGSDEAVAVGYLCGSDLGLITWPPSGEGHFIIRGDCPLHGVTEARRDVQMRMP